MYAKDKKPWNIYLSTYISFYSDQHKYPGRDLFLMIMSQKMDQILFTCFIDEWVRSYLHVLSMFFYCMKTLAVDAYKLQQLWGFDKRIQGSLGENPIFDALSKQMIWSTGLATKNFTSPLWIEY